MCISCNRDQDVEIAPMPEYLSEYMGKFSNDHLYPECPSVWVDGAIIVGAGPAGLATAACLQKKRVSAVVLEKADCIASSWRYRTYDRLHPHIAKQYCELPLLQFPVAFPTFPTTRQFLNHLDIYASHFGIRPRFNENVSFARFDHRTSLWYVGTDGTKGLTTYIGRWLVVATGENAEAVLPSFAGLRDFCGKVIHSSEYKNGDDFRGKNVLVVGCGNSGMEISLDLAKCGASQLLQSEVHVLPREMFGISTFGIAMKLRKFFSVRCTDKLLLLYSWLTLGDISRFGLKRPKVGPLELKELTGKTPLLDVGTLAMIEGGFIKVMPNVQIFTPAGCIFCDNGYQDFDAVILAAGCKSNVPAWLEGDNMFSPDGIPKSPFWNNWRGDNGLYSAGFTKRGLIGVAIDACRIAEALSKSYFSLKQKQREDQGKLSQRQSVGVVSNFTPRV